MNGLEVSRNSQGTAGLKMKVDSEAMAIVQGCDGGREWRGAGRRQLLSVLLFWIQM